MKIKRFEAPDNITAFALVKKELGDDAVILSTKNLDKGTSRARVEVIAAMDYELEEITASHSLARPPQKSNPEPATYGYHTFRPKDNQAPQTVLADKKKLRFEAHDLKMNFSQRLKEHGQQEEPLAASPKTTKPSKTSKPSPDDISRWRNTIINQILVQPLETRRSPGPTVIAMVGPTGVGKTTSAAKLAAWFSLREQQKVTLLSMDCYRIGATEQLRTYASIMRIPSEIVLRRQDLVGAVNRHLDSDLIIIDTAGKSPYDQDHVAELSQWFAPFDRIKPLLVLNATTKKDDLKKIIEAYMPMGISSLILSKIDETRTYAVLCQQVASAQLPVSYLACGQRVPEDFLAATQPLLHALFKQGWKGFNALLAQEEGS